MYVGKFSFFIGGQNSIRGFPNNLIGDSVKNHFLGGDFFLTSGMYLNFPIPYSSPQVNDIFRIQTFVNSGFISSSKPGKFQNLSGLLNKFKDLGFGSLNCSVGVGLVANVMNSIRIELNYCYPIKSQNGVRYQFYNLELNLVYL